MRNLQMRAIDVIERCKTTQDLQEAIEAVCDIYEISHATYHATSVNNLTDHGDYGLTTYNKLWVRRYLDKKYALIDPVVLASFKGFIPIDWCALNFSGRLCEEFLLEAKEFNITPYGMTFPIRGMSGEHALFSINADSNPDRWHLFLQENRADFMLLAHYFHQRVREIEIGDSKSCFQQLSRREKDVIYWLARGKTFEDVADILFITKRTVRAHSESIRHKLGAVNTAHAVAKAISYGVVSSL